MEWLLSSSFPVRHGRSHTPGPPLNTFHECCILDLRDMIKFVDITYITGKNPWDILRHDKRSFCGWDHGCCAPNYGNLRFQMASEHDSSTFFCSTAWHGGPSIETGSNIQTTICFNKNLHTLGMLANKNRTFGNTILVPPKSILDVHRFIDVPHVCVIMCKKISRCVTSKSVTSSNKNGKIIWICWCHPAWHITNYT